MPAVAIKFTLIIQTVRPIETGKDCLEIIATTNSRLIADQLIVYVDAPVVA